MNFQEKLEIGHVFEEQVVMPYLLSTYNNYWIESTHSYKTGAYRGPCIQRCGFKNYILPDFKLYNPVNGHQMLFEAKYKNSAFSISGYPGTRFVAVEKDKVLQYQEVSKIYRCDLYFAIGCKELNGLFVASTYIDHYFNNKFYQGQVCAFPLTDSCKVSKLF